MSSFRPQLLAALAFACFGLAACSGDTYVYPEDDATTPNSTDFVELSPVAPPPNSDEIKPMVQEPQTQIWRPGHWNYEGQRFYWVPGEIITRPSATAVWSPDRWEHRKYGWVFIHGYWQ